MSKTKASDLEERLGHKFKDKTLLRRALTHSSLSGANREVRDLERLEFLGDRVLGLLTAEELWRRYPDYEEGELAPRLNALVRKESCAKAALFFGIDAHIKMSDWEESSGGRKKKAILGDVMEAVLGALYVDGGLKAANSAYDKFWVPNIEELSKFHRDAKTALQEWSQRKKLGTPDYDVLKADGPAHAPAFRIEVKVKGKKPARGEGASKRKAQMAAAKKFLIREGVWNEND
ncbi:MAG: ribonuclease III [Marinicaulis sp.]|nr:ribonuclease III [Marinicaulis sp.]NNE39347.1 ribonuclease III [Marinicaulis sp.]